MSVDMSAVGQVTVALQRMPGATAVLAVRWATIFAVVVGWQLVCDGPLSGNGYLVGPVDVIRDGLPVVLQGAPLQELGHTTLRFLIAFVLTAVLGTLLGLIAGRLRQQVFAGVRDVVSVIYALPMVPFYPLFVLWLGLGARSEIAFGVIHGLVPVVLLVMTASAGIPANYTASSRAMGAGPIRRLWSITLPAVVPDAVSALKVGAALTLLGVLLAELMISVNGVGSFIAARVTAQSAAELDAMVLVVCTGALVVNALLSSAERRVSAWRSTLG